MVPELDGHSNAIGSDRTFDPAEARSCPVSVDVWTLRNPMHRCRSHEATGLAKAHAEFHAETLQRPDLLYVCPPRHPSAPRADGPWTRSHARVPWQASFLPALTRLGTASRASQDSPSPLRRRSADRASCGREAPFDAAVLPCWCGSLRQARRGWPRVSSCCPWGLIGLRERAPGRPPGRGHAAAFPRRSPASDRPPS